MSLRVLVVAPNYPVPENRQAGIFIHRQVVGLRRLGLDCRVITYRPAPPRFPCWLLQRSWWRHYLRRPFFPARLEGVPIRQVFYPRRWTAEEDVVPIAAAAIASRLAETMEAKPFDLIYAHFLWTGGAVGLELRRRFNRPLVAIARGSEMHAWQQVHPHCRSWVRRVVREADTVLANCEDLRRRAAEAGGRPAAEIGVVYNGCDAHRFAPAPERSRVRHELGLDPAAKLLLFCGTLEARKGIEELATAWSEFARRHPDWRLILLGRLTEPALRARLRALERVERRGRVAHALVAKYMQAADAYVQPSRLEGLANATMEAMASALPVITTDANGQRELVEDGVNGWVVPAEDAAALAAALEQVTADPVEAGRRGAAARRTIVERFDPARQHQKLAELLRRAAASGLDATRLERGRAADV